MGDNAAEGNVNHKLYNEEGDLIYGQFDNYVDLNGGYLEFYVFRDEIILHFDYAGEGEIPYFEYPLSYDQYYKFFNEVRSKRIEATKENIVDILVELEVISEP